MTTFDMDLHAQATRRLHAYRQALLALPLTPGQPFRTLALLTTDLPGEAFEVAVVLEDGRALVRRARPHGDVSPGARKVHGLDRGDLVGEVPLSARRHSLEARLMSPGTDGQPVPLLAWAGKFVADALSNSFTLAGQAPFTLPLLDLQAAIRRADLELDPNQRYHPQLRGMNWTVDVPTPEPTSALSAAQVTRQVVLAILTGEAIRRPPQLPERR